MPGRPHHFTEDVRKDYCSRGVCGNYGLGTMDVDRVTCRSCLRPSAYFMAKENRTTAPNGD